MPTDLVIETKGEHRGEGAKEHQKGQRKKEIELDVLLKTKNTYLEAKKIFKTPKWTLRYFFPVLPLSLSNLIFNNSLSCSLKMYLHSNMNKL